MKRNKRMKTGKDSVAEEEGKSKYQPLAGKNLYLDVKDSRLARALEVKIKKLGAAVEPFLSKEVSYVISHAAPLRSHSQIRGQQEGQRPDSPAFANTPSPFSTTPSPSATGPDGKIKPVTRGKTMAQIACKVRSPSPNTVISSAEKLGIKVVSVEAAVKWLEKELHKMGHTHIEQEPGDSQSQSSRKKKGSENSYVKSRRLHQPYLKVESVTQHYRPVYKELPAWPHPDTDTPASSCPFDGRGLAETRQSCRGDRDGQASIGNWASPHSQSGTQRKSRSGEDSSRLVGYPILTAGDLRRQREKRKQAMRRRGFCECCGIKYEDIEEHVKEQSHKDFVRDKKNYESLDDLISSGPSTCAFLQTIVMRHCSQRSGKSNSPEDDGSSDQVLTIDVTTPVKDRNAKVSPAVTVPDADWPGFRTPTRKPQRTVNTDHCEDSPVSLRFARSAKRRLTGESSRPVHGSPNNKNGDEGNYEKVSPSKLQAVVIRRPGAKSVYHSPNRVRSHSNSGVARVRERSLVFGHSPIGSLQACTAAQDSAAAEASADVEMVSEDDQADSHDKGYAVDTSSKDSKTVNTKQAVQEKMESSSGGNQKSRNKKRGRRESSSSSPKECGSTVAQTRPVLGEEEPLSAQGCPASENSSASLKPSKNVQDTDKANSAKQPVTDVSSQNAKSMASCSDTQSASANISPTKNAGNAENKKVTTADVAHSTPSKDNGPFTPRRRMIRISSPIEKIQIGKDGSPKVVRSDVRVSECPDSEFAKSRFNHPGSPRSPCGHANSMATRTSASPGVTVSEAASQDAVPSGLHQHVLGSTPQKPLGSPSFHSHTPRTPRNQTPVHEKESDEEEEGSSSPVFPRSVVHCSTPVVVTTRLLRHASSSEVIVRQDPEEVYKLLMEKQSKTRSRRSLLQDDSSHSSPEKTDSLRNGGSQVDASSGPDHENAGSLVDKRSSSQNQNQDQISQSEGDTLPKSSHRQSRAKSSPDKTDSGAELKSKEDKYSSSDSEEQSRGHRGRSASASRGKMKQQSRLPGAEMSPDDEDSSAENTEKMDRGISSRKGQSKSGHGQLSPPRSHSQSRRETRQGKTSADKKDNGTEDQKKGCVNSGNNESKRGENCAPRRSGRHEKTAERETEIDRTTHLTDTSSYYAVTSDSYVVLSKDAARRSSRKSKVSELETFTVSHATQLQDVPTAELSSPAREKGPAKCTKQVTVEGTPSKLENRTEPSCSTPNTRNKSPLKNQDGTNEFSLRTPSSRKKVKLNGSWLLLSDHSMSRLLHSEPNSSPFKGFTGNHDDDRLPSDLTYEEASEVEVSDAEDHEWVFDNSELSDLDMDTFHSFIPTFSSLGEQSDSSWGDTCDLYLNTTIEHKLGKNEPQKSPRKSLWNKSSGVAMVSKKRKRSQSWGRREESSPEKKKSKREKNSSSSVPKHDQTSGHTGPLSRSAPKGSRSREGTCKAATPTKRSRKSSGRNSSSSGEIVFREGVRKVDEEVAFNYTSPQKSNAAFSPLRVMNGNVVGAQVKSPDRPERRSPSTRRRIKLD